MNAFCYLLALSAEYAGPTHVAINRADNAMRAVIILICTEAVNLSQSIYG